MKYHYLQSRDNPKLKQLRALLTSAHARAKENLTVLEGIHLCAEWLKQGRPAHSVFIAEHADTQPEVQACLLQIPPTTPLYAVSEKLFKQISLLETGGAICCVIQPQLGHLSAALGTDVVVLDGIQDPGNMGSILRSAAAAGVSHALLGQGCVDPWAPKTLRAGMGAQFALNIMTDLVLPSILPSLKARCLATRVHDATNLFTVDLTRTTAWVFGNEGQGLTPAVAACVSEHVTIPQTLTVESMNVAAAAAVCLFEMRRQRLACTKASN